MTLTERIYAADRAKEVLENEAFQQAFVDIKQELAEEWMKSPNRDEEGRRSLYQLVKALDLLEKCLKRSLDSGKLAAEELKHQRSIADKAKSLFGPR